MSEGYDPQDPGKRDFPPPPPAAPPPPQPPGGYAGQPPGYAPPPGYGGGYGPQETDGTAITALILGIASWVICPLAGIAGLIVASNAKRKIDESGGRLGGGGMVTAGRILSIVSLVLSAIGIAIFIIAVIASGGDSRY